MKILKLPSLICDVLLIADGTDSKCTTVSFELEYPTYNRLYILDYIYYSDNRLYILDYIYYSDKYNS